MEHLEICRVCTSYVNSTNAANLFERSQRSLLSQIKDLTGKTLKNENDLPRLICPACEENLQRAYNFRKRCLESQIYFSSTKYLSRSKRKLHDADDKEEAANNDYDEQPIAVLIKEEANSIDTTENHALECIYNAPKTNSESNYPNSVENEEKLQNKGSSSIEKTSNPNKKLKNSKKNKAVKSKPANHRKTPSLKTKKPNEKVELICDQCGNHFTCRHHLLTHLRRHTKDKPFKCEVCPDKFYTHSELKRHMRKHTGEKPFACKHCQRRFTDYSTRIKHERIHTNERPFSCVQCGKAFSTTYVLKNHMLVHTGERSFKCTLCNKAFQRQTHLTVHCRSLMHKQMMEKQANRHEFLSNDDECLNS